MRACETISDASNVVNSNPADQLLLRHHSLTAAGIKEAMRAAGALADAGVGPTAWIWPGVTASAFQTAEILASSLNVRREQIVPEFSFLDARGVGRLNGGPVREVRKELVQNDQKDSSWRPPPGEDGTPNDSTEDVFVRVRQLLSKLETQYQGDDIVILSPDSDPLSILQAAMTGVDMRAHHDHEYLPGEVRRVKELIVDSFGKVESKPEVRTISRPA